MQWLAARAAKAINGLLRIRGNVWGERYHARELVAPRAVRNALVYVLMNVRKHFPSVGAGVDACSSAPWFDGFVTHRPATTGSPVRAPRTWLAGIGWRRHGLIRLDERPRAPA